MQLILGESPHGERAEKPKFHQHISEPISNVSKELNLPEKSDTSKNVYAYLTKTRGIPANIVNDCLKMARFIRTKEKMLYLSDMTIISKPNMPQGVERLLLTEKNRSSETVRAAIKSLLLNWRAKVPIPFMLRKLP